MDIPGLPQRISAKIRPDESTGCWIWTGEKTSRGYGRVRLRGRYCRIHRVVYALLVRELSDADVLDHLCRQKSCCNPAHLEPVTVVENSRRGAVAQRSELCPKRHVKELVNGRWDCRQCIQERNRQWFRDPANWQRVREYRNTVRTSKRWPGPKRRPGPGQAPLF